MRVARRPPLDLARALQGVGGAAIFATWLALLASGFLGRGAGRLSAPWRVDGVAVAFGPLVGGVLSEAVGWQSIFFVDVPMGLAAIASPSRLSAESRDPAPGAATGRGWSSSPRPCSRWCSRWCAATPRDGGAPLSPGSHRLGRPAGAFCSSRPGAGPPMLDLSLFRKPAFDGRVDRRLLPLGVDVLGVPVPHAVHPEHARGTRRWEAGLRFLPITILSFFCAALSGNLTERVPVSACCSAPGWGLVGAGLLLMSGLDADSGWTHLLPGFLLAGDGDRP